MPIDPAAAAVAAEAAAAKLRPTGLRAFLQGQGKQRQQAAIGDPRLHGGPAGLYQFENTINIYHKPRGSKCEVLWDPWEHYRAHRHEYADSSAPKSEQQQKLRCYEGGGAQQRHGLYSYQACDPNDKSIVYYVRSYDTTLLAEHPSVFDELYSEVVAHVFIKSPGTVQLLAVWESGGRVHLAFDLVKERLTDCIDSAQGFDPQVEGDLVQPLLREAGTTLMHIHKLGLVYGGIKPENIALFHKSSPTIPGPCLMRLESCVPIGSAPRNYTPSYLSPEIASACRRSVAASDRAKEDLEVGLLRAQLAMSTVNSPAADCRALAQTMAEVALGVRFYTRPNVSWAAFEIEQRGDRRKGYRQQQGGWGRQPADGDDEDGLLPDSGDVGAGIGFVKPLWCAEGANVFDDDIDYLELPGMSSLQELLVEVCWQADETAFDPYPWRRHPDWTRLSPALREVIEGLGHPSPRLRWTLERALRSDFATKHIFSGPWQLPLTDEPALPAAETVGVPIRPPVPLGTHLEPLPVLEGQVGEGVEEEAPIIQQPVKPAKPVTAVARTLAAVRRFIIGTDVDAESLFKPWKACNDYAPATIKAGAIPGSSYVPGALGGGARQPWQQPPALNGFRPALVRFAVPAVSRAAAGGAGHEAGALAARPGWQGGVPITPLPTLGASEAAALGLAMQQQAGGCGGDSGKRQSA